MTATTYEIAGGPSLAALIGPPGEAVVKTLKGWLNLKSPRKRRESTDATATAISAIQKSMTLWKDQDGVAYASTLIHGKQCHLRVRSRMFRERLLAYVFETSDIALDSNQLTRAVDWAAAMALTKGEVHEPAMRAAPATGGVDVDLGDDTRDVISITSTEWQRIPAADCSSRFIRPPGMRALPNPERGGSLDLLWPHLNASEEWQRTLITGFLLAFFNPHHKSRPLLLIHGPEGSAKSSLALCLSALLDPQKAPQTTKIDSGANLKALAQNQSVIIYDNATKISEALSNYLCALCTGAGFNERELYTDADLHSFTGSRPVVITSIPNVVTAPDLRSRTLFLPVAAINSATRRTGSRIEAEFAADAPKILGAIFDAVSYGLANPVDVPKLPRLADVAQWVTSCEPALGIEPGTFVRVLNESQKSAAFEALSEDPWAQAVLHVMDGRDEWRGTAAEFLRVQGVDGILFDGGVYSASPVKLGKALTTLARTLHSHGLSVVRSQEGRHRTRLITITRTPEDD